VIAPYAKGSASSLQYSQVPRDTGNPVGIRVDHHPRLSTTLRPIANQYREGKVKSTPVRGVKKYLKPCIYKQWKRYGSLNNARPRAFCIMSRLVTVTGEAKHRAEPKRKRV
jgi:hypothetical protein